MKNNLFFVFNNSFWLTCREVAIFLLTQRFKSRVFSRNIKRVHKVCRKFSRAIWKSFSSKHEVLSEYSNLTLGLIFQNPNFFRFSWHMIWLVYRKITIFIHTKIKVKWTLQILCTFSRSLPKFSRGIWKEKVSAQNMKFCQNIPNWLELYLFLMFWVGLFSNASRKLSVNFMNMFTVLICLKIVENIHFVYARYRTVKK